MIIFSAKNTYHGARIIADVIATRDVPSAAGIFGISGGTAELMTRITRHHGLDQRRGVRVLGIESRSPAAMAGLRKGDLVIGFDGIAVTGIDTLQRLQDGTRIGKSSVLRILRGGALMHLPVTPSEAKA